MKIFRQIFAIAHTEFRFGLRRGAPVVVTALIGLILGAAILMQPIANLVNSPRYDEYSAEQLKSLTDMGITADVFRSLNRDVIADIAASSAVEGWFFLFLALLFLPVATAGIIPADRQFGVMELLRSTPLEGTTYLAGKILGVVGIVLFIAIFPFLLFLAVLEGILLNAYLTGIPLYLLGLFIRLTIMDGMPLLAFGTIIGILTGIAFRTRRAAIIPGLAAGLGSAFVWVKIFQAPGIFYNGIDKAAVYVFQAYQSIAQASWVKILGPEVSPIDLSLLGADAPAVGIGQVFVMYALILAILVGLAVLARLWLRWKENF